MVRSLKLIGRRVTLKPIEESSKAEMKSMLVNNEIKKTYMLPDFKSEEELDKYFYKLKAVTEDITKFIYGIYLEDKLIGFLNEVEKKDNKMELGYFLDPKYWDNGYATEALGLAIKELFRIGINTVKAAHFEANLASGRVMEKCGMNKTSQVEYIEYRGVNYRCIYYQIDKDNLIE